VTNVFDDIQFYLFNHHHYIDEPPDSDRYSSTWVNYPNGNFNPEVACELYQRWTREMLLAEELGFDAIAVTSTTTRSTPSSRGPRCARGTSPR
jgi:beta-glucosidase/6-phospho-beta-glucosidase/beta-galactosidase